MLMGNLSKIKLLAVFSSYIKSPQSQAHKQFCVFFIVKKTA